MTTEINIQRYGLTNTGNEDYLSPRKEYALNDAGLAVLRQFFNINITDFSIWLTPKTVEDLLIFNAFSEGFNYVLANSDDDVTTLYASDDDKFIQDNLETASGVYINPKLFLPSH